MIKIIPINERTTEVVVEGRTISIRINEKVTSFSCNIDFRTLTGRIIQFLDRFKEGSRTIFDRDYKLLYIVKKTGENIEVLQTVKIDGVMEGFDYEDFIR